MMPSNLSSLKATAGGSRTLKRLMLGAVLVAVQACTVFPDSPAARLYALDLPPAESIGACPIRFAVRDVRLPGYLDRPELVLGRDGSRTEVSAQHLWAAPLASESTRLLGQGIQERLQGSQLMPYPIRLAERPEWIVIPVLSRFQLSAGKLGLEFSTTVIKADGTTQPRGFGPFKTVQSVPLSGQSSQGAAAGVAQAWSLNMQAHIGDMAVAIKRELCP